jgi:hypothetical protein
MGRDLPDTFSHPSPRVLSFFSKIFKKNSLCFFFRLHQTLITGFSHLAPGLPFCGDVVVLPLALEVLDDGLRSGDAALPICISLTISVISSLSKKLRES